MMLPRSNFEVRILERIENTQKQRSTRVQPIDFELYHDLSRVALTVGGELEFELAGISLVVDFRISASVKLRGEFDRLQWEIRRLEVTLLNLQADVLRDEVEVKLNHLHSEVLEIFTAEHMCLRAVTKRQLTGR